MKLTNAEIFNVKEPLQQLMKVKFPVKTSLALAKLVQKVNEHLIPAEQVQDGLVRTYGKVDPNDSQKMGIQPGDEGWPKFAEEYAELMAQQVEIVFDKVLLPDTLEIEPGTLMALEKFVKV